MSQLPHFDDPKLQEKVEKSAKRDRYAEHIFRRILHFMEWCIAGITILGLLGALGMEIADMFVQGSAYFSDVHHMLHNLLTLIVGLEFVRMLIDLTPANTLEVLIVAIARQVILTHNDPLSNLASVICIAGLFATRRYLISKKTLKLELSEVE